jgi:hypothetical protein
VSENASKSFWKAAMAKDWSDHPGFREYARRVIEEVLPHMKQSAMVMTIAPIEGEADIKVCCEVGMALFLDKPLILVVPPGRHMAERLLRVADHVITADITTAKGREEMAKAITAVTNQ